MFVHYCLVLYTKLYGFVHNFNEFCLILFDIVQYTSKLCIVLYHFVQYVQSHTILNNTTIKIDYNYKQY
jgi:hypothetical protein